MQIGELFVRIRGDASPLSRALRGASGDLSAFDKSVGKLQGSMRALRANWLAVSAAIGTVGFALNKTFQAADAFEASQRKLASTAKITGQNLGFLQTIAADANKEFGIGARMANEFAIEVTKLTGKAGQIEQTGEAIRAFLNLGAGRGLNAAETLQAVQQAILGIDEGTDKLFGKNPSTIYKEFADSVGLVASKMTDGQKALAILSEGMEDGGKVATAYAEYLKSPAGQAEQIRIRHEEMAAGIGNSMRNIRTAAMPVWGAIIEEIREFVEEVRGIPVHLRVIAAKIKVAWGAVQDAFGNSITGGGAGNSAEQRARAELAKVEEAAREAFQRIRAEMNLVTDITGDTNPLKTMMDEATAAAERAAKAAEKVRKAWGAVAALPQGNQGFGPLAVTEQEERARPGAGPLDRGKLDLEIKDGSITANTLQVLGDARNAGQPKETFLGRAGGALKDFGTNLGNQVKGLLSQFGPLAAVAAALRPVFEGLMETLGPVLSTLAEPLRTIGALLGTVIAPVLRLLAPPLNLLAKGVSYVVEAFGWLIEALGRFVDKIVPDWISKAGKGLAKMGQELQQGARDARRSLGSTSDEVADLGEAAAKATAQLVNYANVQHINALRFGIGAGMGSGSGTAGRPGGRPSMEIIVNAVPGAEVLVQEGGRLIERVRSRGGTTRFQLAT